MKRIVVFTIALLLLPAALESNPTVGTKDAKEDLSAQAGIPTQLQELRQNTRELQISIEWLKWIVGLSLLALAGLITYLHSDTKQNIQKLETSTQRDIQELKTDTQQNIQKLESGMQELKTDTQQNIQKLESGMQELKTSTQQNIQELKTSTQRDIQKLESGMQELKTSTRQDMQKLESGMQEIRSFLFQLVQNKSPLPLPARQEGAQSEQASDKLPA